MWEIEDGELVGYRCHVGHAYSAELMSLALDENLTRALATALRALDERTAVAKKLQQQASKAGRTRIAESWERKAREFEEEAKVIRDSVRRTDEMAARFAAEKDIAGMSAANSTASRIVSRRAKVQRREAQH
jgi:two-component system chemotaxis response regulator CheB